MARAIVIIALFSACCGSREDELEQVLSVVRSEIDAAFARHSVRTDGEVEVMIGVGKLSGDRAGHTTMFGDEASLIVEEVEPNVIAHELGHAMGLGHEDDPASVMYKEAAKLNAEESAEQLAELCARMRCRAIR